MVNAILAGILSLLIPGLGQILAGETKKGIIMFIIAIVLGILSGMIIFLSIIYLIYAIYAAYDAYKLANES